MNKCKKSKHYRFIILLVSRSSAYLGALLLHISMKLLLVSLLSLFAFVSCTTPVSTSSEPVPLRSDLLEKKWGAPVVDEDSVKYQDPKLSLKFVYIRKADLPIKKLSSPPLIQPMYNPDNQEAPRAQEWRFSQVANQSVRWYQSDDGGGADFPGFHTEPFAIRDANGNSTYYEVIVCHDMSGKWNAEIDLWLRSIQVK